MEEGAGCVWAVGDEGGRLPWPWLTQAIARALRGPADMRLPPPLPRRGDEDGDTELGRGGGAHQSHRETLKHKGLGRIRPTMLAAGRH